MIRNAKITYSSNILPVEHNVTAAEIINRHITRGMRRFETDLVDAINKIFCIYDKEITVVSSKTVIQTRTITNE